MGIAQFMPGTWPGWGRDENGNGVDSPWEPEDVIPAAARLDCGGAKAVAGLPGDPAVLMLAGYNAGPGAVLPYRGVPPYQEMQNYVRVILEPARSWSEAAVVLGAGTGPAPEPSPDKVARTGDARATEPSPGRWPGSASGTSGAGRAPTRSGRLRAGATAPRCCNRRTRASASRYPVSPTRARWAHRSTPWMSAPATWSRSLAPRAPGRDPATSARM